MVIAERLQFVLRPLGESEIQEQLYGEYHAGSRRRRSGEEIVSEARPTAISAPPDPPPVPSPVVVMGDPQQAGVEPLPPHGPPRQAPLGLSLAEDERPWTGEEILRAELQRLRQEVVSLQQAKERLAVAMVQRGYVSTYDPPTESARGAQVVPVPVESLEPALVQASGRPQGGVWALVGGVLIVSAVAALVLQTVVLEAHLPVHGVLPANLYSVQVGVYEAKPLAQRFVDVLSREGYPAFLMDAPTRKQGRPQYRVYVGRYRDKAEAQAQLHRLLQQHPFLNDSFVLKRA